MNTGITSKEAIMQACRKIAAQKGLSALNMRTVAKECNIALGTLYNYYADKDELLIAAVESVWKDIFTWTENAKRPSPFPIMWTIFSAVSKEVRQNIQVFCRVIPLQ